jgi:hypothetical protein
MNRSFANRTSDAEAVQPHKSICVHLCSHAVKVFRNGIDAKGKIELLMNTNAGR